MKGVANIMRILCQVPQANARLIGPLIQSVIDSEQQLAIKVRKMNKLIINLIIAGHVVAHRIATLCRATFK